MFVPLLPPLESATICELGIAVLRLGASASRSAPGPDSALVESHLGQPRRSGGASNVGRGGRRTEWSEVVERMDEVELRRLVGSLPVIEQAKGILMGYYGVGADRAFTILRRWSSVHHLKVRDLATLLVDHADTHPPDRASATRPAAPWSPFGTVRAFVEQAGLD